MYDDYTTTTTAVEDVVIIAVAMLVWLAIMALAVIALWKIFTKAGEAGWKAIIPVYNLYILYKISWNTKMFFVNIGLIVATLILYCMTIARTTAFFGPPPLLLILTILSYLATYILMIMMYHHLSTAFGHGAGFTVGLVMINIVFIMILAFSPSEYVKGKPKTTQSSYYYYPDR